jgi:hypothetical protein
MTKGRICVGAVVVVVWGSVVTVVDGCVVDVVCPVVVVVGGAVVVVVEGPVVVVGCPSTLIWPVLALLKSSWYCTVLPGSMTIMQRRPGRRMFPAQQFAWPSSKRRSGQHGSAPRSPRQTLSSWKLTVCWSAVWSSVNMTTSLTLASGMTLGLKPASVTLISKIRRSAAPAGTGRTESSPRATTTRTDSVAVSHDRRGFRRAN